MMRSAPIVSLACTLACTLACVPPTISQAPPSANQSSAEAPKPVVVKAEDDPFATTVKVAGSPVQANSAVSQFLRSWVERNTGAVNHQVYVMHTYRGEWLFWNRAAGLGGAPIEFVSINREVLACSSGCLLMESFGASLPDSLLRAHPAGVPVKFYSRAGIDMVVEVTAEQIGKQLLVADSVRAALKK